MSLQNATRAAPAETRNGSQNADRHEQAITEINVTTATARQDDLPLVIAEWRRNVRENVRVSLDRYQDCDTIDVRCWFKADDGLLRPTRTGITLAVRHLPQLAEALGAALTVARERGLLTDDDGGAS